MKQARALKQLIRQYRFDILLRIDTDALIIGDAPHEDVLKFLTSHPSVGMVGAFTRRGDGSNKTAAMAMKGRELSREMSLRHQFRHPFLVRVLRPLVGLAEAQYSTLMDDALLALLCCAAGYRLSDPPEDQDPLAVNWRGLPMSVEALVSREKKIVHPVKEDDPSVEPSVRAGLSEAARGAPPWNSSRCVPSLMASSSVQIKMGVKVRRARTGDEAVLREVRLQALTDAPDAFGSTYERELARTVEDWGRWVSPGATFILHDEHAARGLVACARDSTAPTVVDLMAMWVHPVMRGSGAADALVAEVIAWARGDGARLVRLQVVQENVRAQRVL